MAFLWKDCAALKLPFKVSTVHEDCTLSCSEFLTVQCNKNPQPAGNKLELNKVRSFTQDKTEKSKLEIVQRLKGAYYRTWNSISTTGMAEGENRLW